MRLTVAIPTFNRNAILLKSLREILPQLTSECRLVLIDNHSALPVSETLRELLFEYPDVDVTIVRNAANIGGNANILRCFEHCTTDWIWILGDDDPILPGAIDTILRDTAANPDAILLNFHTLNVSPQERADAKVVRGMKGLLDNIEAIGILLFISANVYNARKILPNLHVGYLYLSSSAPQIVVVLASITPTDEVRLSPQALVQFGNEEAMKGAGWSLLPIVSGLPILLDFPFDAETRKRVIDLMLVETEHHRILQKRVVLHQLLLRAQKDGDSGHARHLFRQYRDRLLRYERKPKARLENLALGLLMRFPGPAYRLVAYGYRKLKGKESGLHNLTDDLSRN